MSGIFNSSRVLPDYPRVVDWVHNNGQPAQSFEYTLRTCNPTQTTTSFRTKGVDSVTGDDIASAWYRDIISRNWLGYSPYDTGHPFDTIKQEWDLSHPLVSLKGSNSRYIGPLIPRNSSSLPVTGDFPAVPAFDSSWYGTNAINRTVPVKPISDMANALGELRTVGGIPKVMGTILNFQSRTAFARSAGREYLNSVFGWAPLVRDIESIARAVIGSNDTVQQYLADSGKGIRRKYSFPEIHTNLSTSITAGVTTSAACFGLGSNDTQINSNLGLNGRLWQVTNHDRKIWFSGQYTYYLPDGIDPASKMKVYAALARKLVGARLSPEVLWELQPWSWLVDWVFNIGQILENIESFQTDGLVLRYGYLMCTDIVTTTTTAVYSNGVLNRLGPISKTSRVTRKQRIRATPYGFGLDPTSWTPERWAILAALGLTKTPTSLR
jgi:hypothetical protein